MVAEGAACRLCVGLRHGVVTHDLEDQIAALRCPVSVGGGWQTEDLAGASHESPLGPNRSVARAASTLRRIVRLHHRGTGVDLHGLIRQISSSDLNKDRMLSGPDLVVDHSRPADDHAVVDPDASLFP